MNSAHQTNDFRCGTVVIVGRPNVGKSTLLNALIGQKLSITSRKAQTTRHRITGIQTTADAQFIFVDTPGFQTHHINPLNRTLNQTVSSALSDVDVILFVIEAGKFTADDEKVLTQLPTDIPVLLIANKTDRLNADTRMQRLMPFMQELNQRHSFAELIPSCAKQTRDVAHVLKVVRQYLPVGPAAYDENEITNHSERFYAAEILREKIFRLTGDEIPYTSTVIIDQFENEGKLRRIFATILVERDNHKAMLIGAKGARLKQISSQARLDMEKLFQARVYLEVWVKIKSGWADDQATLRNYGYE